MADKQQKVVRIGDELHEQLKQLADADHRTLGGEVAFLIESEVRRRTDLSIVIGRSASCEPSSH